jgi:chromosomal replication initiator protein
LTSDKSPREIQTLEERLKTRFESGLIADIQPPDFETRIAIIKRKSEELNIDISDEVCDMLASRLQSNIRQLEGAVKKIKARDILGGNFEPLDIAEESVRNVLDESDSIHALVSKIINEVAQDNGITYEDIISHKRSAKISSARKIAAKRIRKSTSLSLSEIGKILGGRDHATVIHLIS